MKREIKFRAWVPELGIMLQNITLYGDGMMGYDYEEFAIALPDKHDLMDDTVYHKDFDNGNDILDPIMSVLPGEDWIWLVKDQFKPLQFTGLLDKNGKEIYEGDILRLRYPLRRRFDDDDNFVYIDVVVSFHSGCFWFEGGGYTDCNWHFYDHYIVIGNIYENPGLITTTMNN